MTLCSLINFDASLPCEIRERVAGRKSVEPTFNSDSSGICRLHAGHLIYTMRLLHIAWHCYILPMIAFITTYAYYVSIHLTGVIYGPGNTTNEIVIMMPAS